MASTKHTSNLTQKKQSPQKQSHPTLKRELRLVKVSIEGAKAIDQPIVGISTPTDDEPVINTSYQLPENESKNFLRSCPYSQDSISGRLCSVGPIPACGLDDWKYTQQQNQSTMQSNISPANSFNFLRLPFGNALRSGAVGSSRASLIVHAPSLSRVSAQTDDELGSQETESFTSSLIWLRKPRESNEQSQQLCSMCDPDQYTYNSPDSVQYLIRWHSLSALNYAVGLDQTLYPETHVKDSGKPTICCFHKTKGWSNNCSAKSNVLVESLPNQSFTKYAVCSISLPDLRRSNFVGNYETQNEIEHSITPLTKLSSGAYVAPDTLNNYASTNKTKCESWLENWK